jgi:hypothetical protein
MGPAHRVDRRTDGHSWWFEGRTLVAVSADRWDGADNEELQAGLIAVTRLAGFLALAAHAQFKERRACSACNYADAPDGS